MSVGRLFILLPITLAGVCAVVPGRAPSHSAGPVDGFWTVLAPAITVAHGWALQGVALRPDGVLSLAPSTAPLACTSDAVDGGATSYDPTHGLCAGDDPYGPGGYGDGGRSYYNGAGFHYGVALSPPYAAAPFDQAVASWVAATPPGTWMETHLRVRLGTGAWTRWYALPIWAATTGTIRRHSVAGQGGAATVATDTLVLHGGHLATAYQLGVTLFSAGTATPAVRRLTLATSWMPPTLAWPAPAPRSAAWGRDLAVPVRSQMLASYRGSAFGGGGEAWCSPTSTAMILAYWAQALRRPELDESVPRTAQATYDWTYGGTGDWPFNVAHATAFAGMDGYVARFPSLAVLEPWIAAGIPLALSIAFAPGALSGAPLPASTGHLVVLRGFDRSGDPIVNDPAAPTDGAVRRVYQRAAFERAWLAGSNGTAYVIYPRGWRVPLAGG